MWLGVRQFFISTLVLLLVIVSIVDASPASSYHRKVSILQQVLRAEKKFCKAFLHGALPAQSTTVTTKTASTTIPGPTQTVTSTVTLSPVPIQKTVVTATLTSTDLITQTSTSTNLATVTSTVATSTITSTISSLQGTVEIITSTQTDSTTTTTTFTDTGYAATSTVTVTSTQPFRKRDAIPSNGIAARSRLIKPKAVQSFSDNIIADACLLLLYGTFSNPPITSTTTSILTYTSAPVTVTASPTTVPASSTPTSIVPVTTLTTSSQTIPVTITVQSTSTVQTTDTVTTTTTVNYPSVYSGVFTTTTTITSTSTVYPAGTTTETTTAVAKPTPQQTGKGYLVVTSGDSSIVGQYLVDNGHYITFLSSPKAYILDGFSGNIQADGNNNFQPADGSDPTAIIVDSTAPGLLCSQPSGSNSLMCSARLGRTIFYKCGGFALIGSSNNNNPNCSPFTVEFVNYSTS